VHVEGERRGGVALRELLGHQAVGSRSPRAEPAVLRRARREPRNPSVRRSA
jgi:hypothetical protein